MMMVGDGDGGEIGMEGCVGRWQRTEVEAAKTATEAAMKIR
jgi:hypothetical protein